MEGSKWSAPAFVKWIAAFVAAGWFQMPVLVRTLVMLIVLDYASGVAAAFVRSELTSAKGLRGLVKKSMILLLLLAIHIAENSLGVQLGLQIESVVALAYCVNEIVSLIENCAHAGVPIPAALVEALLKAKKLRGEPATESQLKELGGD
jgi:toxin secretion/phage lysis holin